MISIFNRKDYNDLIDDNIYDVYIRIINLYYKDIKYIFCLINYININYIILECYP